MATSKLGGGAAAAVAAIGHGVGGAQGVGKTVDRDDHVYKAKLCEQVKRYDEMADCMKKIANLRVELTVEERNLLGLAYKYVIEPRRESWSIALGLQHKEESKGPEADPTDLETIHMYKHQIKHEMREICHDIFRILDHHLLPISMTAENKVFFFKITLFLRKGDYYRYLTDISIDEERHEFAENSLVAYKAATEIARMELSPTHPIRLGLALNYSVFYHEVLGATDRACVIAKTAFDDAIAELDELAEETYKDSTLIMQQLRDNLTLWTSDVLESGGKPVTVEDVEPTAEDDLDHDALELDETPSAAEEFQHELELEKERRESLKE